VGDRAMRQLGASTLAGLACAAACLVVPAQASVPDANRLWQLCGETTAGEAPDACTYYIMGVIDARFEAQEDGDSWGIPDDASVIQVVNVVRNFLSNHPDSRDRPAPDVIVQAIDEAWPPSNGSAQ